MENKIKNPVSKKNIFFFNIFNRLIDSIENYVHKTEEDTFAENFDILKEDSVISVSPKGSTVEKLVLGEGYSSLRVIDEGFIANVNISNEDGMIELFVDTEDKSANIILSNEAVYYAFAENTNTVSHMVFNKNGIAVTTTNDTTYNIHEPQLSTIVNACEYSYDEDNSIYKLKMLPKVDNIDFIDTPLEIDFGKSGNTNLKIECNDEGLKLSGIKDDSENFIIVGNEISVYSSKNSNNGIIKGTNIRISNDINTPNIIISHKNSSGETNADQVLKFVDLTNNLEVTFTVAELIALKALLPTT